MIAITDNEMKMIRMKGKIHKVDEMKIEDDSTTVISAARALLSLSPTCKVAWSAECLSANLTVPDVVVSSPSPVVSNSDYSSEVSVDDGSHSDWSDNNERRYFTGSTSLSLETDEEALSPLHCFMRKYCVEAFTAEPEDVSTPRYGKSHGNRIVVGQVGIRCIHCKNRPNRQRQERAVCFPSSLKNIYHSIETWQRRHSLVCRDIPAWVKAEMTELLNKSKSGAGGRRQYWEESSIKLGMVDTTNGIRFIRKPGTILELDDDRSEASLVTESPSRPIIFDEDKELVTDFLFLLMSQMEGCEFTEQDRAGGRSKVKDCPTGFPGFQCKHCGGKAGFGRYFPNTLQALTSANSDRNIYNHLMKCRRCPKDVRDELERLQETQQNSKNRRGSRKMFFNRVWERLHGEEY